MKYTVLILLSSIMLFTTCKKYPEGGYHFRYLKNLEGDWKLKLYEVDGIDSTLLTIGANTINDYTENFATINSQKTNRVLYIGMNNHYRTHKVNINPKAELMSFDGGNESGFNSSGCSIHNPQFCQKNIFNPTGVEKFVWKIQKLTKNELTIISYSGNYKITLNKK